MAFTVFKKMLVQITGFAVQYTDLDTNLSQLIRKKTFTTSKRNGGLSMFTLSYVVQSNIK